MKGRGRGTADPTLTTAATMRREERERCVCVAMEGVAGSGR